MIKHAFYISPGDPAAKQRILEEGLRLFAERGLSETSIRDIAAATGFSNPALYKHFKTKEALALTLFERSYNELRVRLTLATGREAEFASQFRAYIDAYTGFYDDYPHAMIFTTDNLAVLWPQASANLGERTIMTLTRELLEEGRREKQVGLETNLSLQLVLVIGTLGQLTRQLYLRAMKGPAGKHVDEVVRILRAGLV
ncbi:MAG: TetR/AcrR family transcriptional regulator [Hyphomicrobiales bacterium]|nr:TetR/AcrR family transcriptional regulator [Hyphomicrobiales bacterium]